MNEMEFKEEYLQYFHLEGDELWDKMTEQFYRQYFGQEVLFYAPDPFYLRVVNEHTLKNPEHFTMILKDGRGLKEDKQTLIEKGYYVGDDSEVILGWVYIDQPLKAE